MSYSLYMKSATIITCILNYKNIYSLECFITNVSFTLTKLYLRKHRRNNFNPKGVMSTLFPLYNVIFRTTAYSTKVLPRY